MNYYVCGYLECLSSQKNVLGCFDLIFGKKYQIVVDKMFNVLLKIEDNSYPSLMYCPLYLIKDLFSIKSLKNLTVKCIEEYKGINVKIGKEYPMILTNEYRYYILDDKNDNVDLNFFYNLFKIIDKKD